MSPSSDRDRKLAATMIHVLTAAASDPSRLGRGRTYARQGAVIDLDVEPGSVTAAVQGSRAAPYHVTIRTTLADRTDTLANLVPPRTEIVFECSCPDWDDPCKHAVAVMCQLAELVSHDESLLLRWRGALPDMSPRAVIGSRRGHLALVSSSETDRSADVAALGTYLGETVAFDQPDLPVLGLPRELWDEPWTAMLRDALSVVSEGIS
jgi:SWIM zinc finger